MSPLRRRMIEDMTIRNLSPATQRSYLNAVPKFSRHFGRSPDRLGLGEVHAFQVHLVATGISWPSLNQIVCALRFFYGVTLGQATIPERIAYAREPQKLPVVLSADEVVRFLEAIPSLKSRTAGILASAADEARRSAMPSLVPFHTSKGYVVARGYNKPICLRLSAHCEDIDGGFLLRFPPLGWSHAHVVLECTLERRLGVVAHRIRHCTGGHGRSL
jgi:hypothetical protein